jgi:hypothetical protein
MQKKSQERNSERLHAMPIPTAAAEPWIRDARRDGDVLGSSRSRYPVLRLRKLRVFSLNSATFS